MLVALFNLSPSICNKGFEKKKLKRLSSAKLDMLMLNYSFFGLFFGVGALIKLVVLNIKIRLLH